MMNELEIYNNYGIYLKGRRFHIRANHIEYLFNLLHARANKLTFDAQKPVLAPFDGKPFKASRLFNKFGIYQILKFKFDKIDR
jgi:hypothetical protein